MVRHERLAVGGCEVGLPFLLNLLWPKNQSSLPHSNCSFFLDYWSFPAGYSYQLGVREMWKLISCPTISFIQGDKIWYFHIFWFYYIIYFLLSAHTFSLLPTQGSIRPSTPDPPPHQLYFRPTSPIFYTFLAYLAFLCFGMKILVAPIFCPSSPTNHHTPTIGIHLSFYCLTSPITSSNDMRAISTH